MKRYAALPLCLLALLSPAPLHGQPDKPQLADLHALLDQDQDGKLQPYEAAEALLTLLREADGAGDGVTPEELQAFCRDLLTEQREEMGELRQELDRDGDGNIQIEREVPDMLRGLARLADHDGNGSLSASEFQNIDVSPRAMLDAEAAAFFAESDANGDKQLTGDELPPDERTAILEEVDRNGDQIISLTELQEAMQREEPPASFEVRGTDAIMRGVIGPDTPGRVFELVCEHPQVQRIVLHDVPGSMDDHANLRAARLVHKHQLKTHVPADGVIASGGVDFFLAGVQRSVARGGKLGVHTWGSPDEAGSDVPRNDPAHRLYLDFYAEVGIPADFYWYTLEAAGPDDVHWMTSKEMLRYRVETPNAGPNKTVGAKDKRP